MVAPTSAHAADPLHIASVHRIRVAHVVLSLEVGGMERVVQHLVSEGNANSQDVTVICLGQPGLLAPDVAAAGARVISLGKPPGLRPGIVRKLRAALREFRPDVMHTHQIGALLYAGPAARKEGVPVVLHTEHINHISKARGWSRRIRIRVLWWLATRNADRFITVSPDIAKAARGIVPPNKIDVVDNGIPVGMFDRANYRADVRERLGIPANAVVIGTVGRLSEVKRQDLLIRAFQGVKQDHPEAQLVLVGDGPERERLGSLASELGLSASIHFAGYQPHPYQFLQAMDIFALTSRLEGMPLAILEAWAARLPVVSTRVGGIPQVVTHDETGILIPSGDQDALKTELNSLLDNPIRAKAIGAAGRNIVERHYDTRQMAANYDRHYRELLRLRHALG